VAGSEGTSVEVTAVVDNPEVARRDLTGFVEAGGFVSMAGGHHSRAVETGDVSWKLLPDIGRTGDGMAPWPVVNAQRTPGGDGARLEYDMTLFTTGPVEVTAYLSPRNAALPWDGLKYAVSIDDAEPQVVDVIAATGADPTPLNRQWERLTSDNVNRTTTTHVIDEPGRHTLKFWMVDPTVILQHLVIDTGGLEPSYLGPPESLRVPHPRARN
ncbi:MAG TPA: hypothetical protein VK891_14665, partial [Euzebyales bacterium]|nr:hypothetical protein [Euzebyales bacterium]